MFTRRTHFWFKALSIPTVVLMVSLWLPHPARLDAQIKQSSRVRELEEQRLVTLSNLVEITSERVKSGELSSDELLTATRARDEAELALCTSDAQRVAVLEKIVNEARTIEEQDAKLVADKTMSRRVLLKATADRLEQEIRLESARAK